VRDHDEIDRDMPRRSVRQHCAQLGGGGLLDAAGVSLELRAARWPYITIATGAGAL